MFMQMRSKMRMRGGSRLDSASLFDGEFERRRRRFNTFFKLMVIFVALVFLLVITFFIVTAVWVHNGGPKKELRDVVHILKKQE